MRGTPSYDAGNGSQVGIIPAYAGNTFLLSTWGVRLRDHPRVCGEHRKPFARRFPPQGSSPRMRGTLARVSHLRPQPGIIPAYAGNTPAGNWSDYYNWDHPRVCGEHLANGLIGVMVRGSSPRMRGTHEPSISQNLFFGIIPAYAGNTAAPVH